MNAELKEYNDFIASKQIVYPDYGFDVDKVHEKLFDFQKDIVKWSIKKGKAALFEDCGLGKTAQQLEWAAHIHAHAGNKSKVLILAPLAVSRQTKGEGAKFDKEVNICRTGADLKPGINITNYEMLSHFDAKGLDGVVLDESSILKAYSGKTKTQLVNKFRDTPYKLACTATPSPNDHMEILNQAEFLGVMKSNEALAIWFINDTMKMGTYRLKEYAKEDFWKWVSSWAISIARPSDLGYEDGGFELPKLSILEYVVETDKTIATEGLLFRMPELSATGYHKEKKLTLAARVSKSAEIANGTNEQFLIWCERNDESAELLKSIKDSVEVKGSDKPEHKEQSAIDFIRGNIKCLISKPSIFGFGLNFQNCHNSIFCGLSYSYEDFYQATRRIWRFGQKKECRVHTVIGDTESAILNTLKQKEEQYTELKAGMNSAIAKNQHIKNGGVQYKLDYDKNEVIKLPVWLKNRRESETVENAR